MILMRCIVALILTALILIPAAGATRISETALDYEAETLSNTSEVKIAVNGILPIKADKPAAGSNRGSPVTMSSSNDDAHTTLVKGNWAYRVTISTIDKATPADTIYEVELKRDDASVGALYIKSSNAPREGDSVKVTFDLGTSILNPEEAFLVTVISVQSQPR